MVLLHSESSRSHLQKCWQYEEDEAKGNPRPSDRTLILAEALSVADLELLQIPCMQITALEVDGKHCQEESLEEIVFGF
jgi:hypothetical protein